MAGGAAGPAAGGENIQSTPNVMTYLSIAVVMMGAAMFGADQNNYGLTYGLPSFQTHWCNSFDFKNDDGSSMDCNTFHKLSDDDKPAAWNTFINMGLNLVTAGMMCGALTLGPLFANFLGRRMTISIGGCTCFIGCAIVAWLTGGKVTVYYVGRFVTGFGCGIACFVLPMYNSEVATLNIRGLTGSLFQFMVVIGGIVPVLYLANEKNWMQGFLIPGYFGLAAGVGAWLCPESPRYLLDRYGKERARPALQRVRQGDVTEEIDFIEGCLREEREAGKVSYLELFTKPGLRWRLFVACYLQAAQQLTGINAFLGYQTDIFGAAGFKPDGIAKIPTGPGFIIQMVFIVGSVTGLLLIDSQYGGRRKQLVGASFFMGPTLIIAAITNFMNTAPSVTGYMVYIFCFGFQLAWGIIPWFYPAELFQMNERERALSISTFCGFLFNLLVGIITLQIFHMSKGGTFLTFGLLNVTNCIFVLTCMKETKGVALESIPAMFGPVDTDSKRTPLKEP